MFLLSLSWETANNVSGNYHIWNVFNQEVTNLIEFFNGVFSVHFVKNWVAATLNRNVQELVHPRMVQNV